MERLQRILASRGVASRRAAETMIRDGRVKVNGKVVTELGTKADPARDEIRVDNQILRQQALRYLILNKPTGYITTTNDERGRWTVMDLIRVPERVFPVGRLDRDTEGLLLFTNDGDVANRVMHPRYGLAKEYHVLTKSRPTPPQMARIREGVVIDRRRIVPREFRLLRETDEGVTLTVTVHEGMYHLVRRMMEIAGIEVVRLRRARIGTLSVQGLRVGEWRDLTPGEQNQLFEALRLDDEAIARAAERPIRVRPSGAQQPANPLWRRPRRPGEKPERKPNVPYYKKPSREEREAAERATPVAERAEPIENERDDKRERKRYERRGPDHSGRPQRDRNRRPSRVRKDDRRGSSR
ncbi:MAG: rRNA pseudouridine synthase [Chloroflexota bacterium]|nr:rRNA pseudouridine synthase [Chloroflexota bacterium]